MKTGIEMIAEERQQQIEKHGRTVEKDIKTNGSGQLVSAAVHILGRSTVLDFDGTEDYVPDGWDAAIYDKMYGKSYEERLIIAGALIAAELDRIQHL